MRKHIVFSLVKISLLLLIVGVALSRSQVTSSSAAFFTSMVTAINSGVGSGDWTAPDAPLFWVEEDATKVKVDWQSSAASDVVGYKVYRSTDDATYTLVGSVGLVNTFTDTTAVGNTDYYYKVTAVDASANETLPSSVQGKYAGTHDVVIDDGAHDTDVNASGTVSAGGTGSWDPYHTAMGGYAAQVLQNAVGGDNFSTTGSATGQTYAWQTTANLNGYYDVYATYICDQSRGVARYDVFNGGTQLTGSPVQIYQSRPDGQSGTAPCGPQATTSQQGPRWVKIGNFAFTNQQGKVVVTAQNGEAYILADAVAFRKTGDITTGSLKIVKYLCDSGTTIDNTQRPNADGNFTVPANGNCTPESGKQFGYIYEAGKNDLSPAYPGLADSTPFTAFGGTTDVNGTLTIPNLNAAGRYDLAEIDNSGNKVADQQTAPGTGPVMGFLCYGDGPINFDNNYEISRIPAGGTATCAVFNRRPLTPPLSYITVQNSPPKRIENRLQNGSFEDGLNHWNVSGDVNLINGADGVFALPEDGTHMVRVGRTTNEGNPARLNVLSQQIPAGVRTLGFYYNMFSYDYKGFDNPGLMVFVNDQMVFQRWASEVDRDDPTAGTMNLDSSGWQYIGLDLSKYPEGSTLTLAFYAGNDVQNFPAGAMNHQTWVYLDNFSTNEAVVNAASQFEIHTLPGHTAKYRIGSDPTVHVGNTFTIDSQPANQTIYYWSENGPLVEPTNSFHVLYDNVAPETITDLSAAYKDTNLFTLKWLSPHDDNRFTAPFSRPTNAAGYEIRYSTTPIDASTDWNSLIPVTIVTEDGLPYGGYRSPVPEHEQETYYVRVADVAPTYYFAVKSFDAATNWSLISNVAMVSPGSPVVVNNSADIVINEFLPNPVGAEDASKPNGQWVELYNKSSADVDANGWIIRDTEGDALTISTSNSDNNLNPADGGETTVPAHGYLVVYRNGDANFNLGLAAAGNVVSLYHGADLIDAHTWNVSAAEDKAFARIPDGTGSIVDPVPTPGRANVLTVDQLLPQVRLWQQAPATAKLNIFDASNYTTAQYLIEYTYDNGSGAQQGGLTGSFSVTGQFTEKTDLYFGTCSGNVCVPHQNVVPSSIKATITLTGPGIPDRTITQPLSGAWTP